MRKCFEGYQKVASTLMSVGGMGNISGPPIAKDMTAASESASKGDKEGTANNELPSVDYGGYWADPCPQSQELTSPYTTNRGGSPHPGIDIAAASGTPVLASAPGQVADVFYQPGGFGNLVVVSHNVGGKIVYSAYNHLLDNSTKVKVGDKVEKGQHLADIGSTGKSSGPHLHFEIRTDWAGSRGDVLNTHADPACLLDRYANQCGYAETTFKIVPKPSK
jgi:murein DD-endopeptidase MepM/ murein hydrolase activator NlpD